MAMKHTLQKTPPTNFPTDSIIGMTFHHDYPNDMSHVLCFFFRGQPASLSTPKSGDHRITHSNCPSVHGSVPHSLGRLFHHGDVDGTRPVDGWWSQQNPTGNLLNPWDNFSSP